MMSWLLVSPVHQQSRHWRCWTDIIRSQHAMGSAPTATKYDLIGMHIWTLEIHFQSMIFCVGPFWWDPIYHLENGTHKRFSHDDVIKWKHFPLYWSFVRGIHRSSVNSPDKGQWRGAFMFSLICVRINGWVNNGEAGDLIRYRVHCDVTVMKQESKRTMRFDTK